MSEAEDPRVYQALMLPNEALEKGGVEILRAGIIQNELYVGALRAFDDPSKWGEVLGEIANRIATIYAAQVQGLNKKDVAVAITQAFASEMGARPIPAAQTKPAKPSPARKAKKPSKKPAKKRKG
jgi:hypothetical protein